MAQIKIGDHVRVEWEDHWHTTDEELTLEQIKKSHSKPYIGKASGVVVLNNRKVLVIASNYWPKSKTYDGSIFCIIKKCITNLKVLK